MPFIFVKCRFSWNIRNKYIVKRLVILILLWTQWVLARMVLQITKPVLSRGVNDEASRKFSTHDWRTIKQQKTCRQQSCWQCTEVNSCEAISHTIIVVGKLFNKFKQSENTLSSEKKCGTEDDREASVSWLEARYYWSHFWQETKWTAIMPNHNYNRNPSINSPFGVTIKLWLIPHFLYRQFKYGE